MRKLNKRILAFALVAVMVLGTAMNALASSTTTVTNAAWWDAWTPTYEIADGATLEFDVTLLTAGDYQWSSLNAAIVSVATDGVTAPSADNYDGYEEYAVLRSDNAAWGTASITYTATEYLYMGDSIAIDGGTIDYNTLLTGATYDIVITRDGTTIDYDYVITLSDGIVLNCGYEVVVSNLADSDSAYVFFTGDAGVSFEITLQEEEEEATTITVTNAAWWDAWTPTYEIADGATLEFDVTLLTAGDYQWSSLNAAIVSVATDGVIAPSADNYDGYEEYAILRSDNAAWGTAAITYTTEEYLYMGDSIAIDGGTIDYNTLLTGATYDITITRDGTTISYDYVITLSDGTVLNCGYSVVVADLADSDSAYVFFTGDAGVSFTITQITSSTGDDEENPGTTDTDDDDDDDLIGVGDDDDDSWSIPVSDVEAGKTEAASLLEVEEDELTTVSSYEVTSAENVGEAAWNLVLTSDEFIAGTSYAIHIGNLNYAEVLVIECTEDGTLTIEDALGTEIAGIYYVADSTATNTDAPAVTSSPITGDVSVWFYVVLLAGAAAAVVVIAKKRVTE